MKVLFVRSGNNGTDPISTNQGDSLEKLGCIVSYFDLVGKGMNGYLRNVPKLKRTVESEGPDIVHAHYSLSAIISSIALSGKPVVASLMGSDVIDSGYLLKKVIRFFARHIWSLTIVKTVEMKKTLGIGSVHVLPNGVSLDRFGFIEKETARQKIGWESEDKIILFASRPDRKEKNYRLAEKAYEILMGNYYRLRMERLCDIPRDRVYLYYNAADVILLTSIHEGSPNVIKEAMACNCPIVSTDVGDVREVISNTDGCYLTSFDPCDVAEKLRLVLDTGQRTNGRSRIGHLDSDTIARRLVELYDDVLVEKV